MHIHDKLEELGSTILRLKRKDDEHARAGRARRRIGFVAIVLAAVALPTVAHSLEPVPHVPTAGAPIVAEEVAENYAHLVNGVTAIEERVGNCPNGMVRVQSFCIDATASGPHDWGAAMQACHSVGKGLCTADELASCDILNIEDSECHTYTDPLDDTPPVWVRSFAITHASGAQEGIFDAFVTYSNDNSIEINATQQGLDNASFCCSPLIAAVE